ncbi:MAG: hypothetical protein EON56_05935 [Alphaproteobacteria bacterium]|nr:MAG: hypothetical protein EON56_05935 [Alphaproteobacteria bacterium]
MGSVIQQARNGDVIWGSGVNGKSWPKNLDTHKKITVASVRGPMTKAVLDQARIMCPAVYGDPALLVPALFQREIAQEAACLSSDERGGIVYIPTRRLLNRLDVDKNLRTTPILFDVATTFVVPPIDNSPLFAHLSCFPTTENQASYFCIRLRYPFL